MQLSEHARVTPEQLERVAKIMLKRFGRARHDAVEFFEMVVKEETTKERIKVAPHQRVVLKFIEDHPLCVVRLPPGFSKTFILASETMRGIGQDPTSRGAVISASQGQAAKPLSMVRDYIESSPELRLVFPKLQPSPNPGDPWQQTKLTVARPRGIRDPSLTAVGYRGKLPGARLKWLFVDDLLTIENTATEEMRKAYVKWFVNTVLSRINGVAGARCVVSNTPYHPDDLTYVLEKSGWPSLTMNIHGDIYIKNDDDWDMPNDIRPSRVDPEACRLMAHDAPEYDPSQQHLPKGQRDLPFFDDAEEVPLWPEKFGAAEIAKLRKSHAAAPNEFAQLYEMKTRNDEDSKVKLASIELCKRLARDRDYYYPPLTWREGRTFTGIDLGIGKKKKHDKTSIFTFGLLPDLTRLVLRVESGRWGGRDIIERIQKHHDDFDSIMMVETNAAQDFLRQWALDLNKSLPIKGQHTGSNKHSKEHGVESVFIEVENGGWLIPNSPSGEVVPAIQDWINTMLYYDPAKHTGDELMACWLARCAAGKRARPKKGEGVKVPHLKPREPKPLQVPRPT